jgi:hypothetical protein
MQKGFLQSNNSQSFDEKILIEPLGSEGTI